MECPRQRLRRQRPPRAVTRLAKHAGEGLLQVGQEVAWGGNCEVGEQGGMERRKDALGR